MTRADAIDRLSTLALLFGDAAARLPARDRTRAADIAATDILIVGVVVELLRNSVSADQFAAAERAVAARLSKL